MTAEKNKENPIGELTFNIPEDFLPTSYRFFWDNFLDDDKMPVARK